MRWFHFLLLALSTLCPPARAADPSPDELAVYRTLFAGERLLVMRGWGQQAEMDPDFLKKFMPHHDSIVAKHRKNFPTADPSTIESFFTRRELQALINPKTDLGIPCVDLQSSIYKQLYPGMQKLTNDPKLPTRGWAAFQHRYPKATAVTYVSRVGFNPDATQALVFLQQTTGPIPKGEKRHAILLDRRNGTWTITKKVED
jgi:hypothetical protein